MAARLPRTLLRTQTDRRLAELAADGSQAAFAVLVERHRRSLLAHCRRLLLPGDAAEDAVQSGLMAAWRALRRGTEVREPKAWLHVICHREALVALRDTGYDHAELHETLHGGDAPEDDLERRTAVRQALAGLAALPANQREALLRTAVEGRSHSDVARELGVGEDAVRGLVYRARTSLRAAATAVTPLPLVEWAAGAGTRGAPLAEQIGQLVAGGGTAVGGSLLVKAGATVAVGGALAGGGVVAERTLDPPAPEVRQARERAVVRGAAATRPATPAGRGGAPTAAAGVPATPGAKRAPGDARGRDASGRDASGRDASGRARRQGDGPKERWSSGAPGDGRAARGDGAGAAARTRADGPGRGQAAEGAGGDGNPGRGGARNGNGDAGRGNATAGNGNGGRGNAKAGNGNGRGRSGAGNGRGTAGGNGDGRGNPGAGTGDGRGNAGGNGNGNGSGNAGAGTSDTGRGTAGSATGGPSGGNGSPRGGTAGRGGGGGTGKGAGAAPPDAAAAVAPVVPPVATVPPAAATGGPPAGRGRGDAPPGRD